jgi:hypothetical protein
MMQYIKNGLLVCRPSLVERFSIWAALLHFAYPDQLPLSHGLLERAQPLLNLLQHQLGEFDI